MVSRLVLKFGLVLFLTASLSSCGWMQSDKFTERDSTDTSTVIAVTSSVGLADQIDLVATTTPLVFLPPIPVFQSSFQTLPSLADVVDIVEPWVASIAVKSTIRDFSLMCEFINTSKFEAFNC